MKTIEYESFDGTIHRYPMFEKHQCGVWVYPFANEPGNSSVLGLWKTMAQSEGCPPDLFRSGCRKITITCDYCRMAPAPIRKGEKMLNSREWFPGILIFSTFGILGTTWLCWAFQDGFAGFAVVGALLCLFGWMGLGAVIQRALAVGVW